MAYIGDIYVQAIEEFSPDSLSKGVKVIKGLNVRRPSVVDLTADADKVKLKGYAYLEGSKSPNNYIEDLRPLKERDAAFNAINHADHDGFIAVETVESPHTANVANMREWTIAGKWLPRSQYERAIILDTTLITNDFGIGFPPIVALPVGSYNVRLHSPWQIVPLSVWVNMTGYEGGNVTIPIYRSFPVYSFPDGAVSGATEIVDEECYRLSKTRLDAQNEYIYWTTVVGVTIPRGNYKIKARIKKQTAAESIALKVGTSADASDILSDTDATSSTAWQLITSDSFSVMTDQTIYTTIKKMAAGTDTVDIDYVYLCPDYTPMISFDCDDVRDAGEVKIFEAPAGTATEANWLRAHTPEHVFGSDDHFIAQNAFLRLLLDLDNNASAIAAYRVADATKYAPSYPVNFGSVSIQNRFTNMDQAPILSEFSLDMVSGSTRGFYALTLNPLFLNISIDKLAAFSQAWQFNDLGDLSYFSMTTGGIVSAKDTTGAVAAANGLVTRMNNGFIDGFIRSTNVNPYLNVNGNVITDDTSDANNFEVNHFHMPFPTLMPHLYKGAADLYRTTTEPVNLTFASGNVTDNFLTYAMDANLPWTVSGGALVASINAGHGAGNSPIILKNKIFRTADHEFDIKFSNPVDLYKVFRYWFNSNSDLRPITGTHNGYYLDLMVYTGYKELKLMKSENGSNTQIGSNYTIPALVSDTYYHIKITFNESTGLINVYWNNSATPNITGTDTTHKLGIVSFGCEANISITGETISIDNFVIMPKVTFADTFATDSSARYFFETGFTRNAGGYLTCATANKCATLRSYQFGEGTYQVKFKTITSDSRPRIYFRRTDPVFQVGTGYFIEFDTSANTMKFYRYTGATETYITTTNNAVTLNVDTEYTAVLTIGPAGALSCLCNSVTATATDTTYTNHGYIGVGTYNLAVENRFDDFSFIGIEHPCANTSAYRGAMLNTFVDDFNWDTGSEWTVKDETWTKDTATARVTVTSASKLYACRQLKAAQFSYGTFECKLLFDNATAENKKAGMVIGWDGDVNAAGYPDDGYVIFADPYNDKIHVWEYTAGVQSDLSAGGFAATLNYDIEYTLKAVWNVNGTIEVFLDGVSKGTSTADTTRTYGYFGLIAYQATAANMDTDFLDVYISAIESQSNNSGTFVCLGGVPHGARYDTIEQAANFFREDDVPQGEYTLISRHITTNIAADDVELIHQNLTDATSIKIASSDLYTALTVLATYGYSRVPVRLNTDDDANYLEVKIQRNTEATDNQPAVITDILVLVPASGAAGAVAFPQDLAFASMCEYPTKHRVVPKTT